MTETFVQPPSETSNEKHLQSLNSLRANKKDMLLGDITLY